MKKYFDREAAAEGMDDRGIFVAEVQQSILASDDPLDVKDAVIEELFDDFDIQRVLLMPGYIQGLVAWAVEIVATRDDVREKVLDKYQRLWERDRDDDNA